jgi:transcriptional regulator of aroF, aroG, tyrA and aromatic amino acid transport
VLEVQLHGCVRGAVEEIQAGCPGVFESAGAGTVVLDEISWMPHKLQERFVNILSIGSIRRLGGLEDIPVGARILATTAQDPNDLLAQHAIIPTLHGYFASHILRVEV